ncbi:class I SAM-dependent methyltransferase [Haloarchaeobius iranensis]|uniref:Methyltransferase domain-containing protein n=1 Tax=Haloarchaeobius iranensis TaxID=996166 RepID=A0A1G9YPW7_9EURY|nr:class I SAM-dependent methyltransferase [Haloarchaeobius iranensis]SDN10625.1 Methyltransferase domain-containing protein [Haloarchaeobius iranensis]
MESNDVRREWAERSGEYSPAYYAHLGSNEASELLVSTLAERVARDASVLELGCSSGRHLAALREAGFSDLTGVDVNADAIDVLVESFTELAADGAFHVAAIEEFLPDLPNDAFDVVFTVETLQHIHPDEAWVFDEIARITGEELVVVENEDREPGTTVEVRGGIPLYFRDWRREFTSRGLEEVDSATTKRDTVHVFEPEA